MIFPLETYIYRGFPSYPRWISGGQQVHHLQRRHAAERHVASPADRRGYRGGASPGFLLPRW